MISVDLRLPGLAAHGRRPTAARRAVVVLVLAALVYAAVWSAALLGTLGVHAWASHALGGAGVTVAGIRHFQQVDRHVWRGSAPGDQGYHMLAGMGVRTVVDLRAEHLSARDLALPAQAGLYRVSLPVRDGQTPAPAQVDAFLHTVATAPAPVFVYCGAGVGRTGAMTDAYLVRTGEATTLKAAEHMLAIGPPSLEQAYYMLTADHDGTRQPPVPVQAVSRILDAPRRIVASL